MSSTIRIVHKVANAEQHFFDLPDSILPPLAPSSVRVKPVLLGLQGSSNLAYCGFGDLFHWWDAFPVPSSLPAPYNDSHTYGVAPSWGFATIIESNVVDVTPGERVWGLLPTHNFPIDLQLVSTEVPRHWIETSPHRQKLMPLYNRFVIHTQVDPVDAAWRCAFRSVWECGYVINRFCFPYSVTDPRLHPMPELGLQWSKEQGNITNAVVVCLGAGGKTSKSFVEEVAKRPKGSGPKGLLEVTSSTESVLTGRGVGFEWRTVGYDKGLSMGSWIKGLAVDKVVIINMGGRDDIAEKMVKMLRQEFDDIQTIWVGGEMKVVDPCEFTRWNQVKDELGFTQMNTSGMRSAAMAAIGENKYFEEVENEWDAMLLDERHRQNSKGQKLGDKVHAVGNIGHKAKYQDQVLGIELKVGDGLRGHGGLEEAWSGICKGEHEGNVGLAFRV